MNKIGQLDHAGKTLELFEYNSKPVFKLSQVESIIIVDNHYFPFDSQSLVSNSTVSENDDVYITANGIHNLIAMISTRNDRCNNAINWLSDYAIPEARYRLEQIGFAECKNQPVEFDYHMFFKNLFYWLGVIILGILIAKIIIVVFP